MNRNKLVVPLIAVIALLGGAGAGIVGMANAQTTNTTTTTTSGTHRMGMDHGIMGTVASVSGTSITVTDKNGTTYTVDASGAKFIKSTTAGTAPATVAISDILVGDTVGVRGTVTGTSVTATEVVDGLMGRGFGGHGKGSGVMGTVSAINGNTVTLTSTSGTTYTVDATKAKVSKVVDLTVSDIKVGDTLGVNGAVSGTSVSATHIMDGVSK